MLIDELRVLEALRVRTSYKLGNSQRGIRFRASLCGSFAEASIAASIDVAEQILDFDWLISCCRGWY